MVMKITESSLTLISIKDILRYSKQMKENVMYNIR